LPQPADGFDLHKDAGMPLKRATAGRSLFHRSLPLESETCWLLLLGVLDLVLTMVLLNTGVVHEANPLARWFLAADGVRGLVIFKCALLAVVVVSAQVIATRHPRTARWVLLLGIVAQLAVVALGARLLARALVG
jgi:hypothetical protein